MHVLNSFVAIDFETLFSHDSVCSVGAVKYINGQAVDTYYTLVQPKWESIKENRMNFSYIHGISAEKLYGQPSWKEIVIDLENFIGNMMLVAHNASFEKACFRKVNEIYDIQTSIDYKNVIDTLKINKIVEKKLRLDVPNIKGQHTLNTLCKMYGVKVRKHHDALTDSYMCGDLLLRMNEILLMSDEERRMLNITVPEPIIENYPKYGTVKITAVAAACGLGYGFFKYFEDFL